MSLEKARVQLLDPDTGAVLAEVDVLTSAPVVSYVNDKKVVRDFRGIEAGESFSEATETSVQDILDKLLCGTLPAVFTEHRPVPPRRRRPGNPDASSYSRTSPGRNSLR